MVEMDQKRKKRKNPKTRNVILFVSGVELEYHLLQIPYFRLASWIFEEYLLQTIPPSTRKNI